MISSNGVPEEVNEALRNLVRAINETSQRCVGVVAVVVFDEIEVVLPIMDTGVVPKSGDNPIYALIETAAAAALKALEQIPKEISPGELS
jgi:quinol-cytochrome oxidoreductase complex cytochrome b subunit